MTHLGAILQHVVTQLKFRECPFFLSLRKLYDIILKQMQRIQLYNLPKLDLTPYGVHRVHPLLWELNEILLRFTLTLKHFKPSGFLKIEFGVELGHFMVFEVN